MLKKIGAFLLTPATFAGAAIGLVCYLLTGRRPSTQVLMLFGLASVAAVVIGVGFALWSVYDWYNSPWEQCRREARELGTVCRVIVRYP